VDQNATINNRLAIFIHLMYPDIYDS